MGILDFIFGRNKEQQKATETQQKPQQKRKNTSIANLQDVVAEFKNVIGYQKGEIERLIQENEELRNVNKEITLRLLEQQRATKSNRNATETQQKPQQKKKVKLSRREQEVHELQQKNLSASEIAKKLKIKPNNVRVYISRIKAKGWKV